MDYASPGGTDTSTDLDVDKMSPAFEQGHVGALTPSDSSGKPNGKQGQKTLRRLAQNREAARRSRLRKKAYVQQLESSNLKLAQLEQELQRARQQGFLVSTSGDQPHSVNGTGALAFGVEYARWLEEHNKQIDELRAAVNAHAGESDLQAIIDAIMARCHGIFRLKDVAAKADAFQVLSGTWTKFAPSAHPSASNLHGVESGLHQSAAPPSAPLLRPNYPVPRAAELRPDPWGAAVGQRGPWGAGPVRGGTWGGGGGEVVGGKKSRKKVLPLFIYS